MSYSKHKFEGINFRLSGEGNEVVVFLHGFLGDLSVWDSFTSKLKNKYTILQIDLPGHGLSDTFGRVHSMPFMAKKIVALIDYLALIPVHLVGHSMGGYVALSIAEQHLNRIGSITLLNSNCNDDPPQKKGDRIRTIRLIELSPELFVNEAINNLFTSENFKKFTQEILQLKNAALKIADTGAAPALRGMAERKDMTVVLAELKIPILFLAGKHDNIIPINSVKNNAKKTGAQLHILEHTNHMAFLEEQHETLQALCSFWQKL